MLALFRPGADEITLQNNLYSINPELCINLMALQPRAIAPSASNSF